ncbi:ATPase, V1/A1 complex, subunit E [Piedraia hortae CBS 480.64]|uniref:ATPase, V1/A1 complex, subunit E n=1 Tax=Piedraia hortae CBS 480.64 TaxID=1314780 RepID=A0A6A7BZZ8_9PEZI|nr:ATPase, V1/A1 complex, subunit E [Piedraia hortae CBS 480.64]
MSTTHAMSDTQVQTELRKMTAFIKQEALEKAREVRLKADEEFSIEKSKLVREETSRLETEYRKKLTKAGMSEQIKKSTIKNRMRLRVLAAKQEVVDGVFDRAAQAMRMGEGHQGGEETLRGLILEGVYALARGEERVYLRCREKDAGMVRGLLDGVRGEVREKLGREVLVDVKEGEWLSGEGMGGVIVLNGSGKIEVNNTLEERLRLLESDALPAVRVALFGENENRKFRD